MRSNASSGAAWGFVAFIGGLILLSDPGCKHGCKTLAEHLVISGARLFTGRA
ncbi:MAG: hypothetical protein HY700_16900 [Gemmatimonadetes bacterium]|nr:hypothetical protein [Gemmatimonadota bacterium]